jgi:hypothetical protein
VLEKKLGSIFIIIALFFISFSGCITPWEVTQELTDRFGEEEKYEWNKKLNVEQSFKALDILNIYLAKVDTYSFVVNQKTYYLHIAVETTFSNFFKRDWSALNFGYINITITDSSGETLSKEFNTLGKDNNYKSYFYLTEPKKGGWTITTRVTGVGTYKIFAEAYEPA